MHTTTTDLPIRCTYRSLLRDVSRGFFVLDDRCEYVSAGRYPSAGLIPLRCTAPRIAAEAAQ